MKIMQVDQLLKTETHYFKPYVRYVLSDFELDQIIVSANRTQVHWSSFNSYERRWGGTDLNGKKVCLYRHNAWGDQLMASSVPRYLKALYPDVKIHLYCHPDVLPLWLGNPFVEHSAIPLPIPFDAMKEYDYHIFYEGMLEGNSEPDQRCCYDDMFSFIGLNDVPAQFKVPYVEVRPEDYKFFNETIGVVHTPYAVYHAAPANMNRAYPFHLGVKFVRMLANRIPVVVVGRDKKKEYAYLFDGFKNVRNLINKTKSFRDLMPIVENASAVVCPDSSVMHLTACFPQVPMVSLWGLFAPNDRSKYYTNDHPIFLKDACPHAPCHDHNFFLPTEQCKDAIGAPKDKTKIKSCAVLSAITPEMIMNKVEAFL